MPRSDDPSRKYVEGPQAAQRFERTLSRVLSVPKAELTKREADYQEKRRTRKPRRVVR